MWVGVLVGRERSAQRIAIDEKRRTEVLDPVHLAIDAPTLLFLERRWKVEADPQGKCDSIDCEEKPVDAAPANRIALDECVGNDGTEAAACDGPWVDEAGSEIAVLHWEQLLQDVGEGELECRC